MLNIIFQESKLAHKYLDGLEGLEIGQASHNPFGLNTKNVDYSDSMETTFKKGEMEMCGKACKVDIVAFGDSLPVEDNSQDFVISSHVIEHFFDPIKALIEWYRVIKTGGYIFIIAPHSYRVPGETRPITTLDELKKRHSGEMKPDEVNWEGGYTNSTVTGLALGDKGHWSVFTTESFIEICKHLNFNVVEYNDVDGKVGNGFEIIIKK